MLALPHLVSIEGHELLFHLFDDAIRQVLVRRRKEDVVFLVNMCSQQRYELRRDAAEFLLCGASAVGVGTALFANPFACRDILAGLHQVLRQQGAASPADLTGKLKNHPS